MSDFPEKTDQPGLVEKAADFEKDIAKSLTESLIETDLPEDPEVRARLENLREDIKEIRSDL